MCSNVNYEIQKANDALRLFAENILCLVKELKDATIKYIDRCAAEKSALSDPEEYLSKHIITIHNINSAGAHDDVLRIKRQIDAICEMIMSEYCGGEVLKLYSIIEELNSTLSRLAAGLAYLCGSVVSDYLSRLDKAFTSGDHRGYTYDIPLSFIAVLDALEVRITI